MKTKHYINLFAVCLTLFVAFSYADEKEDEDSNLFTTKDPKLREPSPCEVCKFFITELKSRLEESGKSKEIIRTGHGLDKSKSFPYGTSELRLTEALLEPHICDKILEYNVHAEREGSNRYAKGISETFQTLHGLVNKGVKVDLGIPYDLWDQPSAEVTKMQRACYLLAERYEDSIEDWYYKHQNEDLMDYLCVKRYLKQFPKDSKFNTKCVEEYYKPKGDSGSEKKEPKKKSSKKQKDDKPTSETEATREREEL